MNSELRLLHEVKLAAKKEKDSTARAFSKALLGGSAIAGGVALAGTPLVALKRVIDRQDERKALADRASTKTWNLLGGKGTRAGMMKQYATEVAQIDADIKAISKHQGPESKFAPKSKFGEQASIQARKFIRKQKYISSVYRDAMKSPDPVRNIRPLARKFPEVFQGLIETTLAEEGVKGAEKLEWLLKEPGTFQEETRARLNVSRKTRAGLVELEKKRLADMASRTKEVLKEAPKLKKRVFSKELKNILSSLVKYKPAWLIPAAAIAGGVGLAATRKGQKKEAAVNDMFLVGFNSELEKIAKETSNKLRLGSELALLAGTAGTAGLLGGASLQGVLNANEIKKLRSMTATQAAGHRKSLNVARAERDVARSVVKDLAGQHNKLETAVGQRFYKTPKRERLKMKAEVAAKKLDKARAAAKVKGGVAGMLREKKYRTGSTKVPARTTATAEIRNALKKLIKSKPAYILPALALLGASGMALTRKD